MHKAWLLVASILVCVSCGSESALRGGKDRGFLAEPDYERLLELNELQQASLNVREMVPYANGEFETSSLSEKTDVLLKMVQAKCRQTRDWPNEELVPDLEQEVVSKDGRTCPAYWFRRRHYDTIQKRLFYIENFESRNSAFLEAGQIFWRRMSGEIQARYSGSTLYVVGSIKISEFKTLNHGVISGEITTNRMSPTLDRGDGIVMLSVRGTGFSHTAQILWTEENFDPKYLIDGNEVEQKVFEDLFSAFELTKVMVNNRKMR